MDSVNRHDNNSADRAPGSWRSRLRNWEGDTADAEQQGLTAGGRAESWQALQEKLHPPKPRRRRVLYAIAAALAPILLLLSYWRYTGSREATQHETPLVRTTVPQPAPSAAGWETGTVLPAPGNDELTGTNNRNENISAETIVPEKTASRTAGKKKPAPVSQTEPLARPASNEPLRPLASRPAPSQPLLSPASGAQQPTATVPDSLLQQMTRNPLQPPKRKVFHLNDIRTPQELLTTQPARDPRRLPFYGTAGSSRNGTAAPAGWIIQLNN